MMRTPSNGMVIIAISSRLIDSRVLLLGSGACRVQIGQPTALRTCCFVDYGIDEGRFLRRDRFDQEFREFGGRGGVVADTPERFDHLVVASAFDENGGGGNGAAQWIYI